MAHIVVIGGGLVGLTTGILLARDGHQVTVTERDTAGPRGNAMDLWQRWDRRGPAPACRAAHAGGGGGAGRQPFGPDGLPAPVAHSVPAVGQPPQRGVDRRDLIPRRREQRGGVLPLERERRALRVVLVVGPGRAGRLGQPGELPLQRGLPLPRPGPLSQQKLTRGRHGPTLA